MTLATIEKSAESTAPAAGRRRVFGRALLVVNVVAILVVAVALRVWRLDNLPGVNGDEAWSGVQAERWLAGEPISWRTPSGNLLNVFTMVPLIALHAIFPPSFALLRSVAAASGILALIANFWLCSRVYGSSTAVISTLFLAVLPINIAYSRFAWDASQSLLATSVVMYLALLAAKRMNRTTETLLPGYPLGGGSPRGPLLAAALLALAFSAAIIVHPTNVFVAPLIVAPFAGAIFARLRDRKAALWTALGVATVAGWTLAPWLQPVVSRLFSPIEWWWFTLGCERLLSGQTIYRFIGGPELDSSAAWLRFTLSDALAFTVIGVALYGFRRLLKSRRDSADRSLVVGAALTLVGFFCVAGPTALAPHVERYGICLIAPLALVLARGVSWWLLPRPRGRAWGVCAWSAVAWLLLAGFYQNYFHVLQSTGGESHRTFRTADVEPKRQALLLATRDHDPSNPLWIVTEEWWNRWPLEYLARGERDVHVARWDELPVAVRDRSDDVDLWFVEYQGSDADRKTRERLSQIAPRTEESVIVDSAGRPVLTVYRAEKSGQNN